MARSTRRDLIRGAAALVAGSSAAALGVGSGNEPILGGSTGERLGKARKARASALELGLSRGTADQASNGDESAIPAFGAAFTKCLPHGATGLVDRAAYDVYRAALESGDPGDFERIPLGGFVKLANPQAAYSLELVGPDASQVACPPAPSFSSAEQAGELVELYWQALVRDLSFVDYEESPLIARAAIELSKLSDFHGPKTQKAVSPRTIFRGVAAGDAVGPYVSQFLWKPIPMRPIMVEQRIRTVVPSRRYLADFDDWLRIQNGQLAPVAEFDPQLRYIRNGRDLGEYVNRDFTYQGFLSACLMAIRMGTLPDGGNPYKHSRTQSAFVTFGQPYLLYLVAAVTQVALTACWYQKWLVHRRLRPEELGGRLEVHLSKRAEFSLHQELLESDAVEETRRWQGTALLAQAYPEGCPAHPSYPAGHAVIAGACATVLKACLDENHEIPDPVEADADGLTLKPFKGARLTVGGELDKLASNIAFGRNFAGIHWRSDGVEGLKLGEAVAIGLLEELRLTGNELFQGYSLRRFDGKRVTVA